MADDLRERWRAAFWNTLQRHHTAALLKEASLQGRLGDWTTALTDGVVATCEAMGWQAAAKGHPLDLLPEARHEYLAMDVMAFAPSGANWRFPGAAMELENSRNDARIAYSLWKVLCVRANLRVVYCYRRQAEQGAALVHWMGHEVIGALTITERMNMEGETLVVVGSRDETTTFPYGFFRWWMLDSDLGQFRPY